MTQFPLTFRAAMERLAARRTIAEPDVAATPRGLFRPAMANELAENVHE